MTKKTVRQCVTVGDFQIKELQDLIGKYHLKVKILNDKQEIPASFWGDPEAGLIGKTIFVKKITPLHSFFHEFSHLICMPEYRRLNLIKDAKSNDDEESAVCYLQILLANCLLGLNTMTFMRDMDDWGYSFRLGSTKEWFKNDANDSRKWLQKENILDERGNITWSLRV